MKRLCIFGDSITRGVGASENGGWATLLRNHFLSKELGTGDKLSIYNLGISGDNTDGLIKRFDVEREARQPDGIMLAIGINDSQFVLSKGENSVSIEKFKSNLESILEKIKDLEIYIVGLTRVDESKTTPIPWYTDIEYKNENIEKYDNVLKELSKDFKVTYIDVSKTLSNNLLPDGVHPNTEGHLKLFEVIKDSIKI